MPAVPTMSEAGVSGYTAGTWFGLLAPAATSPEIIGRLNSETGRILARPELRDRLRTQGIEPHATTADHFGAHLRSESRNGARSPRPLISDWNRSAHVRCPCIACRHESCDG